MEWADRQKGRDASWSRRRERERSSRRRSPSPQRRRWRTPTPEAPRQVRGRSPTVRVSPKATSSRRESVSHYESHYEMGRERTGLVVTTQQQQGPLSVAASSSRNHPARVVVLGERGASADTSTASGTHVPSGAHASSRRILDMAVEGLGMPMPEFKTKPCPGGTFTRHWAPEDQVLRQQWRERIREVIKRRDVEYLFPKDQPAEIWNSDVGPTKERSARVRDCVMAGTGLPRGYSGRGLDGTKTCLLVEDRQTLAHEIHRLREANEQTGCNVLFVDIEGINVPKRGDKIPSTMSILMHGMELADRGPVASADPAPCRSRRCWARWY